MLSWLSSLWVGQVAAFSTVAYTLQVRQNTTASANRQSSTNAAAVVSIPVDDLTDAQRQEVANNIGYRKIGKPVPKDVTLSQIVKTLPSEV